MRLLSDAKVGSRPWVVVTDWCAQGLIDTKATTVVGDGQVEHDSEITVALWRFLHASGKHPEPVSGAIRWKRESSDEEGLVNSYSVVAPQFRKDQVLALLPSLKSDQIKRAMEVGDDWLTREAVFPKAPTQSETSSRGRRPELDRWQAFYFAVIELSQQGRLNADCFSSIRELTDELLDMMGDKAAFAPDHIKGVVSQIHKRFVAR